MDNQTSDGFILLFKEACHKCFGYHLNTSLSETESKHLSNKIFEATGLVIGPKSLKNYSAYILQPGNIKSENPSAATLDTLARYVVNAPYTDEILRKASESHHPYWFNYLSGLRSFEKKEKRIERDSINKFTLKFKVIWTLILVSLLATAYILLFIKPWKNSKAFYEETFHTSGMDSLQNRGWFLRSEDSTWWRKRSAYKDHLTLYTLNGDNWTDSSHFPEIKNLLLRKVAANCFTAEIHFDDFIPAMNWQQAGIILLEDTTFAGKSLRLSIGYNDYFGGYKKPKEILIQAIISNGLDPSKPDEILHYPVFSIDAGQDSLANINMYRTALKIEKKGKYFRFLFAAGSVENFAYKEILSKDLDIHPRYIGLFALQGFVKNDIYVPVKIKYFNIRELNCD